MSVCDAEDGKGKILYKLEPPEGGWGNVLAISMAVMFIVTVGPLVSFGIIYGKFLANLGDEASGTVIVNCIFSTVLNFMGLVANYLLQKHSCRFVGVIGSLFFFAGNFLTVFATSLFQITITYGVLQGIGFGLMMSAVFACFNEYFIKRKNLMMGISQTIIGAATMIMPYLCRFLMDEYGYRRTVAILSAISLHAFAAMLTLQPVQWHMIKVPVSAIETSFLPQEKSEVNIENNKTEKFEYLSSNEDKEKSSIIKLWNWISNFLELSLLKDFSYVNISVGISMSFMSDIMFLSMLPMFLDHMKFDKEQVAYFMTVFMAADLAGRILMSLFTTAFKITNRILFLYGSALTAIVKIVFTVCSGEWMWILILIILMGILRCLIQVTVPLVLAEYSQTRFSAAFGLHLAICGVISLVTGQLSSLVSLNTTGDTWVLHLLTAQILFCVFSWSVEMICKKIKK